MCSSTYHHWHVPNQRISTDKSGTQGVSYRTGAIRSKGTLNVLWKMKREGELLWEDHTSGIWYVEPYLNNLQVVRRVPDELLLIAYRISLIPATAPGQSHPRNQSTSLIPSITPGNLTQAGPIDDSGRVSPTGRSSYDIFRPSSSRKS